jgi:hypothetical protein
VREFQFEPSNLGESREHRLRYVFHEEVVSFGLAADITFGEVARALRELVPITGEPVSIDCLQTSRSSPNSSTRREGAHPIVARYSAEYAIRQPAFVNHWPQPQRTVKKVYVLRSKAVQAGAVDGSDQNSATISSGLELCRRVISKVIDSNADIAWDRLVLGGPVSALTERT